ncbi:(deoxy)nucleoside triphosphate pyrophosphohydrolase [Phytoactinopolyspora halotolerans]|uniref:8-oxo-dGTP diphosphatase n=1 Tax=Phytoactinopolyspora halotolerans TaxID=1981512 RepID=A0A6L9SFX6_9ACTN|nr:NUDIX domain-containing protein [Phytoactinopolyspora halotolerans]NEE03342.1 NUDIX domain-containing protein [Phytoactinopolyspora halotolerans]
MSERPPVIVVAAAIVRDGRLLAARRRLPIQLRGRWELPGGKVEGGESERDALRREIREELAADIDVLERVGGDVDLGEWRVLRAYLALLRPDSADPKAGADHDAVRWVTVDDTAQLDWLDGDRPLLAHVWTHVHPQD